ncbi:MAG: putative toxin-antitoxin system toxin component, PIN family [Gemmatimonadaceae bacterium]|nr:putative toxin-antitoxin system toxin component, PIN family [Gemmatimonadaceae bacterium]
MFLDTNVLVSAFATRGLCADLFRVIIAEHELVVGETVLEELRKVLVEKFKVPLAHGTQVEGLLRSYEVVPKPATMDELMVRDESDRWVLANARAANVDVIITGDADLLTIARKVDLRIISPREFWTELRDLSG